MVQRHPALGREQDLCRVDALGLRSPTGDGTATLWGGQAYVGEVGVPVVFAFGRTPEGGPELRWHRRVKGLDEVPDTVIPATRGSLLLRSGAPSVARGAFGWPGDPSGRIGAWWR